MATKLKNLVITKVALCDEGACSAAHIQLYKRKDGQGGNIMNFEEIMKSLTPEQQAVIKATMAEGNKAAADKKAAEMKAAVDAANAEKDKMKTEMAKMKTQTDPSATEDDILKTVDPAVRAIIEKSRLQAQAAEEAVKKMKEDQINSEAISKAKTVPCVGSEAEISELYKSLSKVDSALCAKTFDILTKANALVEKGAAFTEVGSGAEGNPTGAWDQIEKAAAAVAQTQGISKSKALTQVMADQPELYQAYVQEQEG